MDTIWQDVRYAARALRNRPAFTAIALLTLTVGIGANAAVFSVVNAVLLRPLPYASPQALMSVTGAGIRVPGRPRNLSRPDFQDFERENRAFESLGAHDAAVGATTLSGVGEPERIRAVFVSAGFFRVLRVAPVLGRVIQDDDEARYPNNVVISNGFWQRRFGADRTIIGRAISLSGVVSTIVGVLPVDFRYPQPELLGDPEVYRPMIFSPQFVRSSRATLAIGRLKPGVSLDQAEADLARVASRLETAYPRDDYHAGVIVRPLVDVIVGDTRLGLWLLLGSVLCVLVIGCANLTNLLLAKSLGRHKEIAVRAALGASRARLVRLLLTESVLLGLIGGLCALIAGHWALQALVAIGHASLPRASEISLDSRALLFSAALSFVAGLIVGTIPALQTSRVSLDATLRRGGRMSETPVRQQIRSALVIAEVALAVVLVTGASLLARSFWKLSHVNPGFSVDELLTAQVGLPVSRYPPGADVRFYDALYERLQHVPGVRGVAAISILPLSGNHSCDAIHIDAHPAAAGQDPCAETRSVSAKYFEVMGIPVVRGRAFTARDDERAQNVVIVNQAMANKFWPTEDPVGQTVTLVSLGAAERSREIVGVVANTAHLALSESPSPQYYIPQHQFSYLGMTLVVRAVGEPGALTTQVRDQLAQLDPQLPLFNARTINQLLATSIARPRFQTVLLGAFAALALMLALAGVYGVLAYSVTQRVHEIGIRMCLGASSTNVVWLLIRQGMLPVMAGVGIGLLAAFGGTRLVATLLFGITTTDPITFVAVPLILCLAALIATYVPARRATLIDASVALRGQ